MRYVFNVRYAMQALTVFKSEYIYTVELVFSDSLLDSKMDVEVIPLCMRVPTLRKRIYENEK